jgi:hypothetical protein
MNGTSGPTSNEPLASYDPGSSSWKMWRGMSLWGESSYLEVLPAWGTTHGGELFELPTPVRLISVRASSSSELLPTPTARDGKAGEDKRGRTTGLDLYNALLRLTSTASAPDGQTWWEDQPLPFGEVAS